MTKEEKKRGRPEKGNKKVLIPVRVDPGIVEQLDLLTNQLRQDTGFNLSRADIIRKALDDYIDEHLKA